MGTACSIHGRVKFMRKFSGQVIGWEVLDSQHLAEEREKWRIFVNAVMEVGVE
jgi:hypothetical protein